MTSDEKGVLRELAKKWIELASLPVMDERKRQWAALKDLKAEKPMVLVETLYIENYVHQEEIKCADPFLRSVESQMRFKIRHAEEVGDDLVVEPIFRINWDMRFTGNGFHMNKKTSVDHRGMSHAYVYENPIKRAEDVQLYKKSVRTVDRESTQKKKVLLEEAFGDFLPVSIHGAAMFGPAITKELLYLLGMEQMMLWKYDEPKALQTLIQYIHQERKDTLEWYEKEGLLGLNNNSGHAGSGSPGFTTCLPAKDHHGTVRSKDMWSWVESQETVQISPEDFEETYLLYLADIGNRFGLVYYGCCEPVHDRWDRIIRHIPNIRAVSISPWCDRHIMGEKLGKNIVFSAKPFPSYISGGTPEWLAMENDVKDILKAARNCNLEFIFRDLIDIEGDRKRLSEWVSMTRKMIG
ncbi:MAG TPA: hypothetical protein DCY35_09500 [Prolixibacteraceae bacterium]|nr:hypothetical protein [Prolixibacteraceae bacterium]